LSSKKGVKEKGRNEGEREKRGRNGPQEKPSEGWAEFGAMLFSGTVSLKDVKDIFPHCLRFWRKERLA
jgi:hypothetical protein